MLIDLAKKHGARDTTQRKSVIQELEATLPRRSQYVPGGEIKERNLAVRFAKWLAFNDFGSYTQHFNAANWIDPEHVSDQGETTSSQFALPVVTAEEQHSK
jgi:hypothetical protein